MRFGFGYNECRSILFIILISESVLTNLSPDDRKYEDKRGSLLETVMREYHTNQMQLYTRTPLAMAWAWTLHKQFMYTDLN